MENLKIIFEYIQRVWHLQLFAVNQVPVTVSNIVVGAFLLSFGYWFSKKLKNIISRRVIQKLDLTPDQRFTIESLIFYVLLILTTFFALNVANVPLTVFTFFGGAVAIGVGFGSQNVVNNFMSGLILMIEKPVKVGDIVELSGLRGMVEYIGARSTRIRSFKNTHVIVPNSTFLQENVLNWTLTNDLVLIGVKVGVAYGSPLEKVKELLLRSVKEESRTLSSPEPFVLFHEFGDSALQFEVIFGVNMKNHLDRMKIESSIRFRIDKLFNEGGIVIAFPQMDIHLDSISPVKVNLNPPS